MKNVVMKLAFWCLWPLVWVYAPLRVRARVLVVQGDTFLAVRPYFGTNAWQLPGGGVKNGESYKQAALRELQEEAGLHIQTANELLPVTTYVERGLWMRYVVFAVHIQKSEQLVLNEEIYMAAWLPMHSTTTKGLSRHVRAACAAYKH
jgi:ADP-ribose pyrophosphatase YjhB (NUDIX family)